MSPKYVVVAIYQDATQWNKVRGLLESAGYYMKDDDTIGYVIESLTQDMDVEVFTLQEDEDE